MFFSGGVCCCCCVVVYFVVVCFVKDGVQDIRKRKDRCEKWLPL